MTTRRPAFLRVLLPSLLVVILSGQSMTAVPVPVGAPDAGPSVLTRVAGRDRLAAVLTTAASAVERSAVESSSDDELASRRRGVVGRPAPAVVKPADVTPVVPNATVTRQAPSVPTPKAKSVSKVTTATKPITKSGARPFTPSKNSSSPASSYSGRNRVWIPSLGINRSVATFACTSSAYPGNNVYRWGCAGANNVYLFGHAHSVFKPLHDAYVRGRLSKGMKLMYADSSGTVRTYKVAWWRVVAPDKGDFAYAAQSRPSVTLQTCVGSRSQYRLVVRLFRAG